MIRVTYTDRLGQNERVDSPLPVADVLAIIKRNVPEWSDVRAVDLDTGATIYPVNKQ